MTNPSDEVMSVHKKVRGAYISVISPKPRASYRDIQSQWHGTNIRRISRPITNPPLMLSSHPANSSQLFVNHGTLDR